MKIVYLAAGAGGMYCGSCLHDNTLAAALSRQGDDVLLVPTYTPLRTDEENVSDRGHLFFGGINVFLQQHSALFRHTPWFVDALLNSQAILKMATRGGPSVDAKKLGGLAVSMIQGEHGKQKKEVQKLIHWLGEEARPDVVNLSNTMLLGMAREIRKLGIPVVSTLSGEDIFLEQLLPPYYEQARAALRERAAEIEAFIAFNEYYADFMADYLSVPRQKIRVIPHGLNLNGHAARPAAGQEVYTIGYLARVCFDKGLHQLIAAAELLENDPSLPPFRIRAAGYLAKADRGYLETIQARVRSWKSPERFSYVGELNRNEKLAFLQGLDCFSLPTVYRESKGISALEAMANAVPVVLPEHGAFAELVRDSGAGLLHIPGDPASLAGAIKQLLLDRPLTTRLGFAGREAIRRNHEDSLMAKRHRELYAEVRTLRAVG